MTELVSKENDIAVFTVEIEGKDFNDAINNVYKQTKNQFNIEGFRKGKAPRKIIELNYGKDIFYQDALNDILNDIYGDILDELDLEPIDYPEIDLKDELSTENPFTVEFTVQLMPTAQLKEGYEDANAELMQVELEDEDVEKAIENEREKNARLVEIKDRPAEEGDTLNIDFEGFIGDEAFEGGKGEGYSLELGSKTFIPGFEEGLVGVESGQELDVEVTFPEDYQEDLASKDAVFKVKVNNIKAKELPDLDDDFAMDVSEFDSLEEYKADIRENLEKNVERNNKNEKYNKAIESLVEYLDVNIPDILIENQIDTEMNNFEQQISQMGLDLNSYYQMAATSEDNMRQELRPQAIARLQSDFTLEALAEAEGIEATEEEIDEQIKIMADQYKVEDVDKFVEEYKKGDTKSVENFIVQQKALDKAIEIVDFEIVSDYSDPVISQIPEDEEDKETDESEESED